MNWTRIGTTRHRYLMHDDTLYIWCAGTHGWSQWAHNVDTRTIRYADRRVNTRDYIEAGYIVVELAAANLIHPAKEIVVCGFSRGGAVAQVLAIIIAHDFHLIAPLHLYASKRTSTKVSDLHIECNVSYRGDIVTFLPWWPYRIPKVAWKDRITWIWKAHNKAAHAAARWRHDMSAGRVLST
ncbi:MAG: hypothetical protein LAT56_00270 [Wenzhouxiangella sp.]|nr:hypothetical protein [Wenzhouxiangella sp.]